MKERFRTLRAFLLHYSNPLFFVAGFIFDTVTLTRIDSTLDLLWDGFYLGFVTLLILMQEKYKRGLWTPSGLLAKVWHYESEALHFSYGGLLSAFVIFYFKSTSFSRSLIFLALMIVLMALNEMPQIRRAGSQMRLGLYAFCLVSFANYLFPVLIGRMGAWVFLLAWAVSASLTYFVVRRISRLEQITNLWRLGASPAAVLGLIFICYFGKLIPPVPLSLQYAGVFHKVEREGDAFLLTYQKPGWIHFWRHDDRPFLARPGDSVYCFIRVFGPRRFNHQVVLKWEKLNEKHRWLVHDRVPLQIVGGRENGYRGYAVKSNYEPGDWRVEVETEDGRTLGSVSFDLKSDQSSDARELRTRRM